MQQLAILLTVHNRKEKTLKCLDSVYKSQNQLKHYNLLIYLVDDGSTDGTKEAISKLYPDVKIIQGDGNLFWNRGMHLAWTTAVNSATFDYFIWLNDDTTIHENCIEILLKTSEKYHNQAIIAGSTSSLNDPSTITYGGRNAQAQLIEPSVKPQECAFFNGNIVLVPQPVFNVVGYNDPYFHHALGDFDYGHRAAKLGIQSVLAPGILGECDEHDSLPTWCNPQKPFIKRWKAFRSPLGQAPEQHFVYEYKHYGPVKACFHYLTNHLRVLFPNIWQRKACNLP